jgi:hypothetical protein
MDDLLDPAVNITRKKKNIYIKYIDEIKNKRKSKIISVPSLA